MIIRTVEELRLHLPNHAYDDLSSMMGAFRRSEADVLVEKVGASLYKEMYKRYDAIDEADRYKWLTREGEFEGQEDPWAELTYLCQQVVVFDAFGRSADINAVSVNQSGINVMDAENYDAASKDGIAAYKKQMNKEMHAAVNRLLVWLETCAIEVGENKKDGTDETTPDNGQRPTEGSTSDAAGTTVTTATADGEGTTEEHRKIVDLWKRSKFYYQQANLFVSTATEFQEYVDIYESRERFVTLLPDLRFCQRQYIVNELGSQLAADLLAKKVNGGGNDIEKEAIRMAQEALCLCVETRSKMFSRAESKDEAIGSVARMVEYVAWNIEAFDANAAQSFPQYADAVAAANARKNMNQEERSKNVPKWENNRRGNMLFVTPAVY